ncbi:MAG: hypothetical protein WDM90_16410 [Ferruginibacter sp.]
MQCPFPTHISIKSLVIERPKPGIGYTLEYAVVNMPLDLHARSIGDSVLWEPAINLNDAASFSPIF